MAGGGGKGGGGSKGQQATAGGGVSPQQMAYAQYTFGQNEVANAQSFSSAPMSTMHTQADVGAMANEAHMLGRMSDEDAAAMTSFINNQAAQQKQGLSQGIGALGSIAGGGGSSGGGGASSGF